MESRQPSNNHGNTGKKGKHSLLSLYGYTLCLLLLGAVVFGLTYSAGGANVLKDEELRKAEEEAAAIEAAKPTPTPRAVSTATAGRLIPFLENSLWGYKNTSGEIVILPAFSAANEEEIGFWKFVQYKFAAQWQAVKAYANKKDVQILGDIPIYVSADSVDAWVGGALFELDADGGFARVAGCPPDYFSADGQLWGNPLYNWAYHKKTGYAWWVRRVRHALGIYDLLRIDHFRGFDTYWAIPATSTTARTGKWENGPGMELFDALEAALGKLPIIAEDLGELFPSVRKLLADSTFPGMKVLQFAFSGGDSEYLPHNHVKNSVVYPGTHDNTTLTDWWENGASEKEKAAAAAYLHLTGVKPTAKELAAIRTDDVRIALLRAALGSVADRAIIPMYDWLGLGAEAHLNTPGKLGGNWAWRAADGFAAKALAKTIHDECSVYCRV